MVDLTKILLGGCITIIVALFGYILKANSDQIKEFRRAKDDLRDALHANSERMERHTATIETQMGHLHQSMQELRKQFIEHKREVDRLLELMSQRLTTLEGRLDQAVRDLRGQLVQVMQHVQSKIGRENDE